MTRVRRRKQLENRPQDVGRSQQGLAKGEINSYHGCSIPYLRLQGKVALKPSIFDKAVLLTNRGMALSVHGCPIEPLITRGDVLLPRYWRYLAARFGFEDKTNEDQENLS